MEYYENKDIQTTERDLKRDMQPYSYPDLWLGIFLKSNDKEGELIGDGGMFPSTLEGEWAEFAYRLKKEHWKKGYATEFATAYLRFWWDMPRESAVLQVHYSTIHKEDKKKIRERVYAKVFVGNDARENMLKKVGFTSFKVKKIVLKVFKRTERQAYSHWIMISP